MANPKQMMMKAKDEMQSGCICGLVAKALTTRNLLQLAHWFTPSYAKHEALGSFYDDIVGKLDEIVEVYQGRFGLVAGFQVPAASMPQDIVAHVEEESKWIGMNKDAISNGCEAVKNLLDELEACYLKTIYKLKNLG